MALSDDIEEFLRMTPPFFLACAGGLEDLMSTITRQCGASKIYLGGVSCYHRRLTEEFCGRSLSEDGYSSDHSALALAVASFREAQYLLGDAGIRMNGIGITAVFKTDRVVRSGYRVWLARYGLEGFETFCLELDPDVSRTEQVDQALSWIFGHIAKPLVAMLKTKDLTDKLTAIFSDLVLQPFLLNTQGDFVPLALSEAPLRNKIVFPGSFNPCHYGHLKIAQTIFNLTGRDVVYELTLSNADISKPPLGIRELAQRLISFYGHAEVVIGDLPFFADKSRCYQSDFVVGYDTWSRMVDPAYLSRTRGLEDACIDDLEQIFKDNNSRFYVFGRDNKDNSGDFCRYLIPANWPVSSTKIRKLLFR
jgi:hypothetical protein